MDIKELNCKNCGASISVGAADLQVKCPFCGTQYNTTGTDASNKLAAILQGEKTFLVEAQLDENAVRKSIYNWLGKGFFSPSGFRESIARVTMITVNISSMAFEARAESRWSGEDSRTETGPNNTQRTIVTRRDGSHAENYLQFANLSAALTQDELEALKFRKEDLKPAPAQLNMSIEVPTIASKEDIPRIQELAKGFIEEKERSACASQVGRLLSVSTFVNFIDRYFVFVPAAIYNYEYAGKKYRVVADRKRGTVVGARPVSAVKVTLFVLAILALIAAGVFLFMKYGKAV